MGVFSTLFKGAENQRGTAGGLYFPCQMRRGNDMVDVQGKYLAKIMKVSTFPTRDRANGFAVEFEVVQSSLPDLMGVGTKPSYMTKDNKVSAELWQANVADFMRAAYACWAVQRQGAPGPGQPGFTSPSEVPLNEKMIRDAHDEIRLVGDELTQVSCLREVVISIQTFNRPTKEKTPFTMHRWGVPGDAIFDKQAV